MILCPEDYLAMCYLGVKNGVCTSLHNSQLGLELSQYDSGIHCDTSRVLYAVS